MLRPLFPWLALFVAACGTESSAHRPDVVVVMLDTTRADHLGPFTAAAPTPTPFLERLAELSVVFDNAWTASTATAPSTASVFTGLIPPRHGVESNILAQAGPKDEGETVREYLASVELVALPRSVRTLTEHLAAAGYQTVGIGANPNFCDALGFSRGFEHFSEDPSWDAPALSAELRRLSGELDPKRPTFTYLHFMDPHAPYGRRAPWCPHEGEALCAESCRYRSEVSFLDAELGRLFDDMGWLEDAIVVVVTDHGEEFGDHGGVMHRYSVHQELARAGLMLRAPGLEPQRTALPAHHTDLLPTILDLLALPAARIVDGRSLVSLLAESEGRSERPLLTCRVDPMGERELWGLTFGSWRLLEDLPSGTRKLYDLESDPKELRDLSGTRPEVLADLLARLERLRTELLPLEREHVTVDLTDRLEKELRHLGYVGDEE